MALSNYFTGRQTAELGPNGQTGPVILPEGYISPDQLVKAVTG